MVLDRKHCRLKFPYGVYLPLNPDLNRPNKTEKCVLGGPGWLTSVACSCGCPSVWQSFFLPTTHFLSFVLLKWSFCLLGLHVSPNSASRLEMLTKLGARVGRQKCGLWLILFVTVILRTNTLWSTLTITDAFACKQISVYQSYPKLHCETECNFKA